MVHMPIQKAFPGMFKDIEIEWSKPMIYDEFMKKHPSHDKNSCFYMLTGKYSDYPYKLFYIGRTYNNSSRIPNQRDEEIVYDQIFRRLRQPDHKKRYEQLKKEYPHHTLYVGVGTVYYDKDITPELIDKIETILIFSHFDYEKNRYMLNKKKVYSYYFGNDQFCVTNRRHRGPLYKEISHGIFVKGK
ncbi:MAG TPA: hypothetical protein ENL17_01775 [Candidatus Methanoperedenaceae archaeon]|nr:hypothetical protein [Candidatus Methanoperedenaceae archaeon]